MSCSVTSTTFKSASNLVKAPQYWRPKVKSWLVKSTWTNLINNEIIIFFPNSLLCQKICAAIGELKPQWSHCLISYRTKRMNQSTSRRSRWLHLGLVCIPTLSRLVWPVVFLRPSMNNGTHSGKGQTDSQCWFFSSVLFKMHTNYRSSLHWGGHDENKGWWLLNKHIFTHNI